MAFRFTLHELYCDGGVIGHNPSHWGGTWAYRILEDGIVIAEKSGVITPRQAEMETVSNNLTEMLALVHGLSALPSDWTGTVLSDSQITLGRAFDYWKWNNVPDWVHQWFVRLKLGLIYWPKIKHILVQGHPTKAQLEVGIGPKGYPVSEHNKWCDEACGEQAQKWMAERAI